MADPKRQYGNALGVADDDGKDAAAGEAAGGGAPEAGDGADPQAAAGGAAMSTDGSARLALLTAAPGELSLLALLSSLAEAIAARTLTITKAAVLTAAREKRLALGDGGWTKAHAAGLNGVLQAFNGAPGVEAEAGGLEREYRTAATVAWECVCVCVY